MSVEVQGIQEFNNRLRQYQREVRKPKTQTRILSAGGQKVRQEAAKSPTPKSSESHYYYSKSGKVEILPGNLRRSMRVYKGRDGDVFVGPHFIRRLAGVTQLGRTQKASSGYYAAMLYKTATAFRQRIMEPAMERAARAALVAIEKAYDKFHKSQNI